jgi:hypothetical protein
VSELRSSFIQVLKAEHVQPDDAEQFVFFMSLQESCVFEEDTFEFEDSFS